MAVLSADRLITPAFVGGRSASNVMNGVIAPYLPLPSSQLSVWSGSCQKFLAADLFFRHFVFLVGSYNKPLLSHFVVLFSFVVFVVSLNYFLLFVDLGGGIPVRFSPGLLTWLCVHFPYMSLFVI